MNEKADVKRRRRRVERRPDPALARCKRPMIFHRELSEQEKDKAYLVLVDPEFAVRWTRPRDVSWKELAAGVVKLISAPTVYMNARGFVDELDDVPDSLEGWEEFCGFDNDESEKPDA